MTKRMIRYLGVFVVLMMAISMFAGCSRSKDILNENATSSSTSATEGKTDAPTEAALQQITLKIFNKNVIDEKTEDPVAKAIQEKTGVTMEFIPAVGDPKEKQNLMLASGDLPDVIMIDNGSDVMDKYISGQAVIPLDLLIESYGKNIKKQYGDTLKKARYQDGKVYGLPDWFGMTANEPITGMLIRKDYVAELGMLEVYEQKGYFSAAEFVDSLKKFKQSKPEINGHKSIPMTIWQENLAGALLAFKGMYGLKSYTENNGALQDNVRNHKYREMLLFMNRLFREGLLDPEWPSNKQALWNQKLAGGYVLSTPDAYWNPATANAELVKQGVDHQFFPFKVVADGIDPKATTYGPSSVMGWDRACITKANRYPEQTMKFLDYLASDEGQILTQWGVEGQGWDMVDGKRVPKQEITDLYAKDYATGLKQTGIRKYAFVFKTGLSEDGTPYDMLYRYERDEIAQFAIKYLLDSCWDTSVYDGLMAGADPVVVLSATKCGDISTAAVTKIILSNTDAEAQAAYDKMVKDMEAAGLADVEKVISDNYKKRRELFK